MPRERRGAAFAFTATISLTAYPTAAFLAFLLVPRTPLGVDGWRWVTLVGAGGAIIAWWLRLGLPESPRWLAQHGRHADADRVARMIETRIEVETGRRLPTPQALEGEVEEIAGSYSEIFRPPYLKRTIMLVIFQLLQTIGYYGFTSRVPMKTSSPSLELGWFENGRVEPMMYWCWMTASLGRARVTARFPPWRERSPAQRGRDRSSSD